jgi:hypothetical protein
MADRRPSEIFMRGALASTESELSQHLITVQAARADA